MARRGLYQERPPALQTKDDMGPTMLMSWWCTSFALLIILVRVCGRYIRTNKLFQEDRIMAASIIPLMIRMALVHVILIWGTNNTATDNLSTVDLRHREIGSQLVLASRIFYAAFIWTAKLTALEFLKRIVGAYWRRSYEMGLQILRYFLLATFAAVIIATLSECRPFEGYWQVIPDPGPQCREGVAQLLTMATCDIVTDLLLVVYPVPIICMSSLTTKRKISLVLLFALSLALVALTAYRVPSTMKRRNAQQYRSLLASLEILAAAGVSNGVVIGSFIRDRGVKRPTYRPESIEGLDPLPRTMTRQATVTQRHWGSDFDLVSDMCMRPTPDQQSQKLSMPFAPSESASLPLPPLEDDGGTVRRFIGGDISAVSTNKTELERPFGPAEISATTVNSTTTPQTNTFFNVVRLIGSSTKSSSSSPSRTPSNHSPPSLPPSGCQAQSTRHESYSRDASHSIADGGGLISNTQSCTDLVPSSTPMPATHQRIPLERQQPETLSPRSRCDGIRGGIPYTPLGGLDPRTTQPPPPPPPPSYRPRREPEMTRWNGFDMTCSMDIADAGGLLK